MKICRFPFLSERGWLASILLSASMAAGCMAVRVPIPGNTPDGNAMRQAAAAQATQLVLSAQATAIVLQAQVEATAIVGRAQTPRLPVTQDNLPQAEPTSQAALATEPTTQEGPDESPPAATGTANRVELLGVGLAAEGGLIIVQFRAPPEVARRWQQGDVYVTDEKTGETFVEIPVMPSVGPLFGRPKLPGQIGYFMLVNPAGAIHSGSMVTVTMGLFIQKHVVVQ